MWTVPFMKYDTHLANIIIVKRKVSNIKIDCPEFLAKHHVDTNTNKIPGHELCLHRHLQLDITGICTST